MTKVKKNLKNLIEIADFKVESETSDLKEVEETMDRLIEKHKTFSEIRNFKVDMSRMGVY